MCHLFSAAGSVRRKKKPLRSVRLQKTFSPWRHLFPLLVLYLDIFFFVLSIWLICFLLNLSQTDAYRFSRSQKQDLYFEVYSSPQTLVNIWPALTWGSEEEHALASGINFWAQVKKQGKIDPFNWMYSKGWYHWAWVSKVTSAAVKN